LGIIFIVFLSLFSLDAFSEPAPWYAILAGFLIHLIPALVLLIILLYAWRSEFIGGIIFLLLSIVFTFFFGTYKSSGSFILITMPVILTGILFILHEKLEKKR